MSRNHGGARKGAGRPPAAGTKRQQAISVTLPPNLLKRMDEERGKRMNRSQLIRQAIKEYLDVRT